ncbi:MAG: murein biosynthesis integral membrane protein MurJ [Patescibacteria group bacterium]
MLRRIWHKLQTTVAGGAIIIAFASIVSRLLGLLRDRLFASTFGAGDILDSYYAAFRLPDLIFNVLVLGALSAAFIPVFLEYWQKDKEANFSTKEAWRIANSVLNIICLILLVLGLFFFIFATPITRLITPGFSPVKQAMTVDLTRIMLASIFIFGISNIFGSILNSFRKFLAFAFAPVMYNIGIIFGILLFYKWWGVEGLAWGVVVGAFLHLAIQVPSVLKTGFRYQWLFDFKHPGVRKMFRLILPRTFGLAVGQINQLVITVIASFLAAGSLAVFNLANNLQSFPINVIGVSLAIAAFPLMSEAFAARETDKFVVQFSVTLRRVLFLIIPASVLFILLRAQIVRVILGAGAFDWQDTYLTAQALGYFSLSLFAQSLIPMLARSFYAHQDTKTPVKISVVSLLINILGSVILSRYMGILGLALSFSISNLVNMALLILVLRRRFGDLDDKKIINSTVRILLASFFMGGVIWLVKRFLVLGLNMQTFVGVLLEGVVAGAVGVLVYLAIAFIFHFDEISILRQWLFKKKKEIENNEENGHEQ